MSGGWTMGMARRLAELCGGRPAAVETADLAVLDQQFPDVLRALEALAKMGRKVWSDSESRLIARLYPTTDTFELARQVGVSPFQLYRRASWLGLAKSAPFRRELARQCGERLKLVGASTRYPPGHSPANKGVKGWQAGGRSRATQFKMGHRPQTYRPIGSVTTDRDGYLKIKVSDEGKQVERWRFAHVLAWERSTGRLVPKGHAVVFRDSDKANVEPSNLELVSRAELMRRNTIHNLPEPIKRVLFAKSRLTRVIREKERSQNAKT